jgi:hypothetical protein
MTMLCPASMCPLIAPKGSPWTGQYGAPCPGHADDAAGGCGWWTLACSTGGIQAQVEEAAAAGGAMLVVGPNQPRRTGTDQPRSYECPKAKECRWQEQAEKAGRPLCPPRDAMARGMDPRVTLF